MPQSYPMDRGTCLAGDRMARSKNARANRAMGLLSRLRRDVRGNTLAIVAAAMIPLIAMVGGGVDVSRMYLAKVRLQHACDAGALAGRKAMGAGVWAPGNITPPAITPEQTADQFFKGNFRDSAYGTLPTTHKYTESNGDVSGTASVVVPMTLMKFFGMPQRTMTVACDAQMQLPNTDVMFVLDNTGSMLDYPDGTYCGGLTSGCKINVLKNAVKCFYESVAQYKTDGTCSTSISGSGVNASSQIRFGFVPYSSNVRVGQLLPTSYFANNWNYQTRVKNGTTTYWSTPVKISNNCNNVPANTSTSQYTTQGNGNNCKTYESDLKTAINWDYGIKSVDISGLKSGTSWNSSISLALNDDGSSKTINWDGCIEERQTIATSGTPTFTVNANNQVLTPGGQVMKDLDIDAVPSQSDSTTLWGPALPGVIFTRDGTGTASSSWSSWNYAASSTPNLYQNSSSYYCPQAAKKLQVWANASDFDTYVNSLIATGNTYHDIGLLWGARLMSPTGIFASENAATPTGGQIQRHMIFMTDGDTNTDVHDYNAYGVPWFDRRQTPNSSAPSNTDTDNQVNARFAALCTATKNKGITLWVVSFGAAPQATTKSRLQACATDSNHYFDATDASSLNSAFQLIAAQITQLRLTK